MTMSVLVKGEDGTVAKVDPISGEFVVIGNTTTHIHEGIQFFGADQVISFTNGAIRNVLFRTPVGKTVHATISVISSGVTQFELFEDAVVSADGTPLNGINRNRVIAAPPDSEAFHTPTITDDGTPIGQLLIESNKASALSDVEEWLLKPDTNYLFRVENVSGGTSLLSLLLDWTEIPA